MGNYRVFGVRKRKMSQDLKTIQEMEKLTDLPEGWVWTEFGDILEDVEKVNPKENPEVEFDYLDIASIDNKQQKVVSPKKYLGKDAPSRARQIVRSGDILFSTVRTYLKNIAIVGGIYDGQIASTGFCVIRLHGLVNNRFFFYLVLTDDFLNPLNQIQRGTSYPAVRNSDIYDQAVPLPPFPEQRRIVEKIEELFTRLDAGIDSLRKVQAQLKRYRQSVLKAAVEGKLTEEWREAHKGELEPASVLLERILKERREKWEAEQQGLPQLTGKLHKNNKWNKEHKEPALLENNELPELPDQWMWTKLSNLTNLSSGRAFKKSEYVEQGIRLFQIANVSFGRILWENLVYMPTNYLQKYPELALKPGDILMALNRPILDGKLKIGQLQEKDTPAILYQRVGRFDFYNHKIKPFFFHYTQSPFFVEHLRTSLQGVDQPFVNKPRLLDMPFLLPPVAEQEIIVEEIERRLSVADEIESTMNSELKRAERLRQSILKQAFSGRLVPQDPSDEPASVLLEGIKKEKQKRKRKNEMKFIRNGGQMELPIQSRMVQ